MFYNFTSSGVVAGNPSRVRHSQGSATLKLAFWTLPRQVSEHSESFAVTVVACKVSCIASMPLPGAFTMPVRELKTFCKEKKMFQVNYFSIKANKQLSDAILHYHWVMGQDPGHAMPHFIHDGGNALGSVYFCSHLRHF